MKKIKLLSLLLAAVLALSVFMPVLEAAADTSFSDVAADAWYADAVAYVQENGLMSGTGPATFSPNASTDRAMLASILYRASGSPDVTTAASFSDVAVTAWYADAVTWASEGGIMSGYGNGLFGSNDAVTREQIASILWRYAGSPSADASAAFSDESAISSFAADAVNWARSNAIVTGKEGNRFDPRGTATRAEIATILRNYMTLQDSAPTPDTNDGKILVVYFSATGNTGDAAQAISDTLNADIFEIVPTRPYSAADLDWSNSSSRVSVEHNDSSLQNIALVSSTVDNWASYDTVFIGYPIWWGVAAWPTSSFVSANDFTGKTVIPFCTSASSGIGQSGALLAQLAGEGDWQDGRRFRSGVSDSDIRTWLNELNIEN